LTFDTINISYIIPNFVNNEVKGFAAHCPFV